MKNILIIFCILFAVNGLATNIKEIQEDQLEEFWLIDKDNMGQHAPIEMVQLFRNSMARDGGTTFEYQFVVDSDGYPKEFNFIGATPAEGVEDKDLLKRFVLFQRYKPSPSNTEAQKVLVKVSKRIWNPDN